VARASQSSDLHVPARLEVLGLTEVDVEDFVTDRVWHALLLVETGCAEGAEQCLRETLDLLERAVADRTDGLRYALTSAMSDVACELGLVLAGRGDTRSATEVLARCHRAFGGVTLDE
jgi:hypothetical protein